MEEKSTKITEVKIQWDSPSNIFRDEKTQNIIKVKRINSSKLKKLAKKAHTNRVSRDNFDITRDYLEELKTLIKVVKPFFFERFDETPEQNIVVISSRHLSKYKKTQLKKHISKHGNKVIQFTHLNSAGPSGSPKK